jgi:hypothetical protein
MGPGSSSAAGPARAGVSRHRAAERRVLRIRGVSESRGKRVQQRTRRQARSSAGPGDLFHDVRGALMNAGVTSPGGRPAAAGHPRRRRRRTGRRRRRQAEPGRAAGSRAPCAPRGHDQQPRAPPTPRREHDKSGNLATPASQPLSLPSCAIRLAARPCWPGSSGNGRDPGRRGASPEGGCRVEFRGRRCLTRRCYRAGPGVSGDQAELAGPGDGLGAVGGAELAQDVGHVLFDRVERHEQVVGDALV